MKRPDTATVTPAASRSSLASQDLLVLLADTDDLRTSPRGSLPRPSALSACPAGMFPEPNPPGRSEQGTTGPDRERDP